MRFEEIKVEYSVVVKSEKKRGTAGENRVRESEHMNDRGNHPAEIQERENHFVLFVILTMTSFNYSIYCVGFCLKFETHG